MQGKDTVLVMAGAREAHGLITALLAKGRGVVASLPEAERMFDALPVPTRTGSFETTADFRNWVSASRVRTVIDASHVFDSHICDMVSAVCTRDGLNYVRILRPPWAETADDCWRHFPDVRDAAESAPPDARVFTNTGWPTIPDYATFSGAQLFMRQTHENTDPARFEFLQFIEGQPPFTQFQEQQLFETLGITHLICRNVGGAASMSKILAARSMRIPVLMISRPVLPGHLTLVETVAQALEWEAKQ